MKSFAGGWVRKWHIMRTANRTCDWLVKSGAFFRINVDSAVSTIPGNHVPWRVKPLFELVLFLSIMRRRSIWFKQQAALSAIALEEIMVFDWHDLARFDSAAWLLVKHAP